MTFCTTIFRRAALSLTLLLLAAAPSYSQAAGEVILTLKGGAKGEVHYDMAALQALPKTTFTTSTMWTEGAQTFEGVELATLAAANGITGGTLIAAAINDYRIEIPFSDAVAGGPIVAYHMNGAEMPLREKGPLWLVYPYDLNPEYQTEVIFSRSIWQLNSIELAP